MTIPLERTYRIRRGDAWPGETFRMICSIGIGFWDGAEARSAISLRGFDAIAHEFDLTGATITQESSVGILTFTLSMTPQETAALVPGYYVGDVEVTGTNIPTSTLISFTLEVVADVTR